MLETAVILICALAVWWYRPQKKIYSYYQKVPDDFPKIIFCLRAFNQSEANREFEKYLGFNPNRNDILCLSQGEIRELMEERKRADNRLPKLFEK